MRSVRAIGIAAAGVVAVGMSSGAKATTIIFGGTINKVLFSGGDPFGGQVQLGTPFNGLYQFNNTLEPACNAVGTQCSKSFSIPPYLLSFTIGTFTSEAHTEFDIIASNDTGNAVDFYSVLGDVDFGNQTAATMGLFLEDATHTAIGDPRDFFGRPPNLTDFAFHEFQINGGLNQGYVHGQLQILEQVPEPSTLALLSVGLLSLGALRRRKPKP